MRARLGWIVLLLVNAAVAAAPYVVTLPAPHHAIAIDTVLYSADDGPVQQVSLPHRSGWGADGATTARYRATFDLPAVPETRLFVFAGVVNHHPALVLNGAPLTDGRRPIWSGPLTNAPVLHELPRAALIAGRNELTVATENAEMAISGLLSPLYIGEEADLLPAYKMRILSQERLAPMAFGAHLLLSLGILICYLRRPREPLFAWLAAMIVISSAASVGLFAGLTPAFSGLRPYCMALLPSVGLLFIGIALAFVGASPPRWFRLLIAGLAVVLMAGVALDILPDPHLLAAFYLATVVCSIIVATSVIAWHAVRDANMEAYFLLSPFFLTAWFMVRDAGVSAGVFDGAVLLSPYMRPILLAAVLVLLMHRLVATLDRLDHANDTLNQRLAAREAELTALHHEERAKAAHAVRAEERQRLTRDLHDGIGGHLVSIIAMAEQPGSSTAPIEQAARQALDDLRLVIYSLDLGDRELPLALANFRERLIPQLRRAGVTLDWSMIGLPDVSGVTPGNALAVLRILQEAVTNALRHGPATVIAIRGAALEEKAAIVVDNDGAAYADNPAGFGVANMRQRVAKLGGEIRIAPYANGTRVIVLLPTALPDMGD